MTIPGRCPELLRRSIRALYVGASLCGLALIGNLMLLSDASAYIDPGTGTMIIQVLGALIASALFYLRSIRVWLAAKLGLSRNPDSDGGLKRSEADEPEPRPD